MTLNEINVESFYQGMSENYDPGDDKAPHETNLKDIDNITFEDIDMKDYPDFCDAYVSSADMNGWPMSQEELNDLNENYGEWVYEKLIEYLF